MSDFHDTAAQIHTEYEAQIDGIRSNRSLSDEGRKHAIARAWRDAAATLQGMQEKRASDRASRKVALEQKHFNIGTGTFLTGSEALDRRDAMMKVSQLNDPNEALGLMEAARDAGDFNLMRAIAHKAAQRQSREEPAWVDTLTAFANGNAQAEDELSEYLRILNDERRGFRVSLHDIALAPPAKPAEIAHISDYAINEFVDGATA